MNPAEAPPCPSCGYEQPATHFCPVWVAMLGPGFFIVPTTQYCKDVLGKEYPPHYHAYCEACGQCWKVFCAEPSTSLARLAALKTTVAAPGSIGKAGRLGYNA